MRIYRFAFILHDSVWEHSCIRFFWRNFQAVCVSSRRHPCVYLKHVCKWTDNACLYSLSIILSLASVSMRSGWQPQRSAALIIAWCLNANTENDIPCQQCTSDTSLSLQIPPFCSRALFSTLVSRQWERFPLLVSIKRVNSLHLSTYHLRAPAWRADDLSVLPDTVWETVISFIRDRARGIISDMILTIWTPPPPAESDRPVTSSPQQRLLLSQGALHTGSHLLTKWKIWWTCNQKFVDARISYRWISQTCQHANLKLWLNPYH